MSSSFPLSFATTSFTSSTSTSSFRADFVRAGISSRQHDWLHSIQKTKHITPVLHRRLIKLGPRATPSGEQRMGELTLRVPRKQLVSRVANSLNKLCQGLIAFN